MPMIGEKYEWVAEVSSTGRFYYLRMPKSHGEKLHHCKVKVVIEVLREPVKYSLNK